MSHTLELVQATWSHNERVKKTLKWRGRASSYCSFSFLIIFFTLFIAVSRIPYSFNPGRVRTIRPKIQRQRGKFKSSLLRIDAAWTMLRASLPCLTVKFSWQCSSSLQQYTWQLSPVTAQIMLRGHFWRPVMNDCNSWTNLHRSWVGKYAYIFTYADF